MSTIAKINLTAWICLSLGSLIWRGLILRQWAVAADHILFMGVALFWSWFYLTRNAP